jgi:hypothetical protein
MNVVRAPMRATPVNIGDDANRLDGCQSDASCEFRAGTDDVK